jgi:hypothetical protein
MPLRRPRGGDDLIDRNPQNLPVPLGGFAPVHRTRRTSQAVKVWRRYSAGVVALIGLIGAALGGYLAWLGPQVAVYAQGSTVSVAGTQLTLDPHQSTATRSVFTGAATLEIVNQGNNREKAAAITYVGGVEQSGVCQLVQVAPGQLRETCSFTDGTTHLTSTDTLNSHSGSSWQRRYSDGKTVTIQIPSGGSVVPMPFLVGH